MDSLSLRESATFSETLGHAIVPAINKLQDIFSQARKAGGWVAVAVSDDSGWHIVLPAQALDSGRVLTPPLQVSPDVKLDLPQIAVVGSQSSGKSSVLEALVSRAKGMAPPATSDCNGAATPLRSCPA